MSETFDCNLYDYVGSLCDSALANRGLLSSINATYEALLSILERNISLKAI